jgi:hypothetical protein
MPDLDRAAGVETPGKRSDSSVAERGVRSRDEPASTAVGVRDKPDDLSDCNDLDPALSELFEQVTRWLEAGEAVDEEQLAAAHPVWAREIRALLPALRGMARAGQLGAGDLGGASDGRDAEGRRVVGDFQIVREIGRGGKGGRL